MHGQPGRFMLVGVLWCKMPLNSSSRRYRFSLASDLKAAVAKQLSQRCQSHVPPRHYRQGRSSPSLVPSFLSPSGLVDWVGGWVSGA